MQNLNEKLKYEFNKPILILTVIFVITFIIFFIWKTPEFLLKPSDIKPKNPKNLSREEQKELIELRNEYRKTLSQIVGGALFLFGLYLTYRRITATERSVEINREVQITERFTIAIEQLGHKRLEVRLGGIYALERIARDSERDHWTVMEILTAYIRERVPFNLEADQLRTDQIEKKEIINEHLKLKPLSIDIQAALTVLGRRKWISKEPGFILLDRVNIRRAYLVKANLDNAILLKSNLKGAYLQEANLKGADLFDTNLEGANLLNTNLNGAILWAANLQGSRNLEIKQISKVRTLYEAKLDLNIMKQIKKDFPHLLERPKD